MSTPIPRYSKLAGLDLYAPRRARTHPVMTDDRWRAKLERIATAHASIKALEADDDSNPDPEAISSSTPGARTAHPQLAQGEAADWPLFSNERRQSDRGAAAHARLAHRSGPDLAHRSGSDRGAESEPAITTQDPFATTQYPTAFAMLARVSVVVCLAAMAALGLTIVLTVPSDGHSHRNAGNNSAAAQAAPGAANSASAAVRGAWQGGGNSTNSGNPTVPEFEPLDGEQATLLMQRGRDLLKAGDVGDARLAFQLLADRGNADAALALATTFDPHSRAVQNSVGVVGDEAKARAWYRRAMELGSTEAKRALIRMVTQ
jgi:TPR repeat protein